MITKSNGRFGVIKRVIKNKSITYKYIARGSKKECLQYMIALFYNSSYIGWCSDVQLSFSVFPTKGTAYFSINKYIKNEGEQFRIEYEITKYQEL